jgi:death-on-curing family protein
MLEEDEPLPPFNERFPGKLEGIVNSVNQTYDGIYLNNTVLDAAASYFNQFIRGHSFQNGNKRLALLYTHWFLLRNGVEFTLNSKELYNFAVAVAKAGELQITPETTREWCKSVIKEFTKDL